MTRVAIIAQVGAALVVCAALFRDLRRRNAYWREFNRRRSDRLIIDDPHDTATPEQRADARAAFLAAVRDRVDQGGPVVIILARQHGNEPE